MAFSDLRAYQERLDAVCGLDWSVEYQPWGDRRIIARLTIRGVTRSSTGEMDAQDEKNNMGGTVAEAQAMKRAAAMWGLGRYLYELPSVWVEFDAQAKRITKAGETELDKRYREWYARKTAQKPQDARQPAAAQKPAAPPPVAPPSTPVAPGAAPKDGDVLFERNGPEENERQALNRKLHAIGSALYGKNWEAARHKAVEKLTEGAKHTSAELTTNELVMLVFGFEEQQAKRQPQPA